MLNIGSRGGQIAGASAAVGAIISIQVGAVLAKSIIPIVGGCGVTALRVSIGAALLAMVRRPWRGGFDAHTARLVLPYGIALGGLNLAFYKSLETLPLGVAVSFELLGPIMVACASSRRIEIVWAVLAIAGLAQILPIRHIAGVSPVGTTYALLAAFCWALYIVCAKRAARADDVDVVGYGMICAAMLTVPIGIASAGSRLLLADIVPRAIAIGILSAALPYALEYFALKRLTSQTFSLGLCAHPIVAMVLGTALLGEVLTRSMVSAALCIAFAAGGSAVTTYFTSRSKRSASEASA